ncbi:4-carboxymuconolactone decarboxylase [Pedobacter sp. AW1-32]|uniref:4-carboxymuconolactone decarboxylase n=1 Tax=Pedobacter sp. AW1-32 TaxID=3383026 RepID=UPI003FEF33A4
MMNADETYLNGIKQRKKVLGEEHVENAESTKNAFNADFQHFITKYAWGEVWTRPGLNLRERSFITLSMLIALNREHEFRMHVRAAINNGVVVSEIKEIILQAGLYCGLPAANAAYKIAEEVFDELEIVYKDENP